MKPLHQQEPVREVCAAALQQLGRDCPSMTFAVMVSDDGFEVASAGSHAQEGGRLASMTSSMQALGDAVAREMKLKACDHILLESINGHILQRRIPNHELVLCAVFDHHELVGRAVFATAECASTVSTNLMRQAA
jgi:uncharacterized protein